MRRNAPQSPLHISSTAVQPVLLCNPRYGGYPEGTWAYSLKAALANGVSACRALKTASQAAGPIAHAALGYAMSGVTGRFVEDNFVSTPSPEARDPVAAASLWQVRMGVTNEVRKVWAQPCGATQYQVMSWWVWTVVVHAALRRVTLRFVEDNFILLPLAPKLGTSQQQPRSGRCVGVS